MAVAAELGGVEGRKAAAELADGRAGGAEDDGLGHGDKASDVAWPADARLRHHRVPRRHRAPTRSPSACSTDEGIAHDLEGAPLAALLDSGEARTTFKHLALHHADGRRWLVVGLGSRDAFDAERARVAAAAVHGRARELGTRILVLGAAPPRPRRGGAALVEGTILAAYRFDRYRARPDDEPRDVQEIVVSSHHDVAEAVERGAIGGRARRTSRATCRTRRPTT